MSDLAPYRGGLERPFRSAAERRTDKAAEIEVYRHNKATEVTIHKLFNVDYATYQRMASGALLAEAARQRIEQNPDCAPQVMNALADREILAHQLFRPLGR